MAVKISKSKYNNQRKNKLLKSGAIKKTAKKKLVPLKKSVNLPPKHESDSEESVQGQDMLEMVEEDDLEFIKNAVYSRTYTILNKIKHSSPAGPRKKRRLEESDDLEEKYEETVEEPQSFKHLLPIKTKQGILKQQIVEESEIKVEDQINTNDPGELENEQEHEKDEVDFTLQEDGLDLSQPISATQLIITRNEMLTKKKIHIGTLSAGLLENPEEKILNLKTLLNLMDEEIPEVFFTVRKLVMVSLLEVFKDILPSYEIKKTVDDGVKLKKDTLKLQKYEETLLLYYKKFLQKLEKCALVLRKKRGDSRKVSEEHKKLGQLALNTMCELLISHPYFNYSPNICQFIVPYLDHSEPGIREGIKAAIKTVLKDDKKKEMSLQILRTINNYLKKHSHNMHVDMLEVLLVLNLKDVNLDQEKEEEKQEKRFKAKKHKILQMSKREKKRKKMLQKLEKEMLETKGEESSRVKQQNLTEITKILFGIFFRILKSCSNPKILSVCLAGLTKFSHCINFEFYVDLINILNKLLKEEWVGFREKLYSIQTVFAILSGQGEALNIDPAKFYTTLYNELLTLSSFKDHNMSLTVLRTLQDALVKRHKKVTTKRILGFSKRLATLSLQLLHHESLGILALLKNLIQTNRNIDVLLDLDNSSGEGQFQPELEDPEYANAASTALYEMVVLSKHYHPIVAKYAKNIASGVPTTGEGVLPSELAKCTPEQLYNDYNMCEMAFNPPVTAMKKAGIPKNSINRHEFLDASFKEYCKSFEKNDNCFV